MLHTRQHQWLIATLVLWGCSQADTGRARSNALLRDYAATDGSTLQATLVIDELPHEQRLASATHFEDGSCLVEEATIDRSGRLRHAAPERKTVKITQPAHRMQWTVPSDLPWVYAPLVETEAGLRTIATPLSAMVTQRAAAEHSTLRTLDLSTLDSATIMADQLFVADQDGSIVVVGDDAVDFVDGLPHSWHNAALDRDLGLRQSNDILSLLAAFSCSTPEKRKT
jgi:hypothetical protein